MEGPAAELVQYAETVITVCILSIVITAPLGAIVITIAGPRLLTKTTKPPVLEGKTNSRIVSSNENRTFIRLEWLILTYPYS